MQKERRVAPPVLCCYMGKVINANQQLRAMFEQRALSSAAVMHTIWPDATLSTPPDAGTSGPKPQKDWEVSHLS